MSLVVIGSLDVERVIDPINIRSRALVFAENERVHDNHMCFVDDSGISALLKGRSAPCLDSRLVGKETVELRPSTRTTLPRATRLVPLDIWEGGAHGGAQLAVDLDALDRGTRAHQETLALLRDFLAPHEIMALSTPKADAAWLSEGSPETLVICEVKSLADGHEAQQVRLGIGQLLDYAHTVRRNPPSGVTRIQPVLVLERKPVDERWLALADSLGITLTWAPDFTGLA